MNGKPRPSRPSAISAAVGSRTKVGTAAGERRGMAANAHPTQTVRAYAAKRDEDLLQPSEPFWSPADGGQTSIMDQRDRSPRRVRLTS